MSVWDEVVGQEPTVGVLQQAVASSRGVGPGMTHAWLFAGPPGSGRSVAAKAFAAALQCEQPVAGCGTCHSCRTVLAGSHADITLLRTEVSVIPVDLARELVLTAARRPSTGRWRVIVVEDADRLNEKSGNALLKAIEEPTERTVWLLCAPSADDVLVTIRSRCRHVGLRTPAPDAVADLLVRRDGVDPAMAAYAARAAQSHIGMARRLALNEDARTRRRDVVRLPLNLRGVGESVLQAGSLLATATAEAEAATADRDASERADLLRALGADPAARTQPPYVRSQLSEQVKEHKRRAKRFVNDMVDRSLVDLLSVYRDVLLLHADERAELVDAQLVNARLVNAELRPELERLARALPPEQVLTRMNVVREAREVIASTSANVLMTLEAMTLRLRLDA